PTASAEPTSPDLTPGPSASASPSTEPSEEASGSPAAPSSATATPPPAATSAGDACHDRSHARPGVFHPGRGTRQRRSGAGAPRGAQVHSGREGGDDRAPRGADETRVRRSPDLDRHPRWHDPPRRQREE